MRLIALLCLAEGLKRVVNRKQAPPGLLCYKENPHMERGVYLPHPTPAELSEFSSPYRMELVKDNEMVNKKFSVLSSVKTGPVMCQDMAEKGIGSSFAILVKTLTWAYINNVSLATPGAPKYYLRNGPRTCLKMPCFGLKPMAYAQTGMCRQVVRKAPWVLDNYTVMHDSGDPTPDPPEFTNRTHNRTARSHFWWVSQVWRHILRPDKELKDRITKVKKELKWEENRPILAIHVRGTDSCADPDRPYRKCESIEHYKNLSLDMIQKYGYKSIYIATESSEYLEEARHVKEWPNLLVNPEVARHNSSELYEHSIYNTSYDKVVQDVKDYLVDLFLFAASDGMIGKFTSTFERIALALQYGQTGCAKPYLGMDGPWCTAWGERVGLHRRKEGGPGYSKRNFAC